MLPTGKVLALLGPNGAGKSTTLKVLGGLLPATHGCVHLAGRHVNGVAPHQLARIGLSMIPEGRGVFPRLTVRENLRMASYSGVDTAAIEHRAFELFPRLGERRDQVAGTMSGGEQQMLALARGLATEQGVSILVVEQFARTVLGVADLAAIMANGRVTAVGPPSEIEAELSSAYLGATK